MKHYLKAIKKKYFNLFITFGKHIKKLDRGNIIPKKPPTSRWLFYSPDCSGNPATSFGKVLA